MKEGIVVEVMGRGIVGGAMRRDIVGGGIERGEWGRKGEEREGECGGGGNKEGEEGSFFSFLITVSSP